MHDGPSPDKPGIPRHAKADSLKLVGEPFWVVLRIMPFSNPSGLVAVLVGARLQFDRKGSGGSFSEDFVSALKAGLVPGVVSLGDS